MSRLPTESLVDSYLERLERALAAAPPARRAEVLQDMRAHIDEAVAGLPLGSSSEVKTMLERLGAPEEVAAAAFDEEPAPSAPRAGALEIAALALTPLVWPVGVILLWTSPAWSVRDKLIGTLLPPGGYLGVLFFGPALLFGVAYTCGSSSTYDARGKLIQSSSNCPPPPPGVVSALFYIAVVLVLLLPILSGTYLGLRLRRRGRA